MQIVVGGSNDVEEQAGEWPTAIISAVDSPSSFLPECMQPHERLLLYFSDTTDSLDRRSFSHRHTQQFLGFANKLLTNTSPDQRLLVHCHDGISRSPALTFAFLAMAYGESVAVDELLRLAPHSVPNPLVIHRIAWAQPKRGPMWQTFEEVAHEQAWLPSGFPPFARLAERDQLAALAKIRPKVAPR